MSDLFSKKEIEDYESKYKVILPELLKKHLTEVSQTLPFGKEPAMFDPRKGPFTICSCCEQDCNVCGNLFLPLVEESLSKQEFLCVKGKIYGKVVDYGNNKCNSIIDLSDKMSNLQVVGRDVSTNKTEILDVTNDQTCPDDIINDNDDNTTKNTTNEQDETSE
jgi:hypothetical protein